MRLLERDPRVRLRSLRQLQQSAFYMSYNFEHVKAKKVSPRSILEKHFPLDKNLEDGIINSTHHFPSFDQYNMAV
ncbi:hypothetical protein RR46_11348 [Papilio xuthus]|uniref:Uncharacterized protein n=1 Tax=Papilio xuthus TaxID=66420 RepID=A0A194PWX2_PAPXU|nr:hypothetical protein RR46_11348 [Papilio xuthus]